MSHSRIVIGRVKSIVLLAALVPIPPRAHVAARVRPGIEVLVNESIGLVRGKRIGFVTNLAAVDGMGTRAIDRLRGAGLRLVALFAPEHGLTLSTAPGEAVASGVDSVGHIPIYSLYGRTTAPTAEMLRNVDILVVDLPDVGARYFTYIGTTIDVMKSAAAHHVPVLILDRPNPLGGTMQGGVLDTAFASAVGRLAVPMRHGLTLGEEAQLAKADLKIPGRTVRGAGDRMEAQHAVRCHGTPIPRAESEPAGRRVAVPLSRHMSLRRDGAVRRPGY